jgi:hypothetical protein
VALRYRVVNFIDTSFVKLKLACEFLDPATPKERAEQMVVHQGEPVEAFERFKGRYSRGQCEE